MAQQKKLSVFVDESGIMNESDHVSRYYILTMLLHDQSFEIGPFVFDLDCELDRIGIANLCFHAGPIIRASQQFEFMN